jgi:hypothetical protein
VSHQSPSARDEHVAEIVDMMLDGRWKGAQSHRELAKKWRHHPHTVANWAIAASAIIRHVGNAEERVRAKLAELEHQQRIAMQLKKPLKRNDGTIEWYNAPDVKAANKAVETYLEVLGAKNHIRRTQEVSADPVPDEHLKQQLEEALEAVKARIAEKREGTH